MHDEGPIAGEAVTEAADAALELLGRLCDAELVNLGPDADDFEEPDGLRARVEAVRQELRVALAPPAPPCAFCAEAAVEKNLRPGRPVCWEHCGIAADGHHEAEPGTARIIEANPTNLIVDVTCRYCGQEASTSLFLNNVDWG